MKKYTKFLNENLPYEGEDWILDEEEDIEELTEKAEGKLSDMSPEKHKLYRQNEVEGVQWHKDHPISHENIVHHYNQATHDEVFHGDNWYKDAQHLSKAVAKDTGIKHHTMAGLIANYSPRASWAPNIMTASIVARHKRGMGGIGSGVFANGLQKEAAQKILNGDHYDKVLKGNKIRAFGHLIEHGGDKDPKNPRVAVDRHAYSVAAGARITDAAFDKAPINSAKGYKHVSDAYVRAAKVLSEQHGRVIHPHQVQSTTWLVRQRMNAQEEHASKKSSRTAKVAQTKKKEWEAYAGEHHPDIVGKAPGTGYDKD